MLELTPNNKNTVKKLEKVVPITFLPAFNDAEAYDEKGFRKLGVDEFAYTFQDNSINTILQTLDNETDINLLSVVTNGKTRLRNYNIIVFAINSVCDMIDKNKAFEDSEEIKLFFRKSLLTEINTIADEVENTNHSDLALANVLLSRYPEFDPFVNKNAFNAIITLISKLSVTDTSVLNCAIKKIISECYIKIADGMDKDNYVLLQDLYLSTDEICMTYMRNRSATLEELMLVIITLIGNKPEWFEVNNK